MFKNGVSHLILFHLSFLVLLFLRFKFGSQILKSLLHLEVFSGHLFLLEPLFKPLVIGLEKYVLRVVHDDILVFRNHVQGVKHVDGVVNAPLDVFEYRFVGLKLVFC